MGEQNGKRAAFWNCAERNRIRRRSHIDVSQKAKKDARIIVMSVLSRKKKIILRTAALIMATMESIEGSGISAGTIHHILFTRSAS